MGTDIFILFLLFIQKHLLKPDTGNAVVSHICLLFSESLLRVGRRKSKVVLEMLSQFLPWERILLPGLIWAKCHSKGQVGKRIPGKEHTEHWQILGLPWFAVSRSDSVVGMRERRDKGARPGNTKQHLLHRSSGSSPGALYEGVKLAQWLVVGAAFWESPSCSPVQKRIRGKGQNKISV